MIKARIAIVLLLGIILIAVIPLGITNIEASSETHTWAFCSSGFFPKHLSDSYYGSVQLGDLADVPSEVQGVYWYDCSAFEWKFWAPGAPGATLTTLGGGHTYDYMVTVTGSCDWGIPLLLATPTPTPTPMAVDASELVLTIADFEPGWMQVDGGQVTEEGAQFAYYVSFVKVSSYGYLPTVQNTVAIYPSIDLAKSYGYLPTVQNTVAIYPSIDLAKQIYQDEKPDNISLEYPDIGDDCFSYSLIWAEKILVFRQSNVVVWLWLALDPFGDIKPYGRIIEERISQKIKPLPPIPSPTPTPTLTPTPPGTWSFYAPGFFPKHIPDSYTGQVALGDLNPTVIPPEVQGVYWYDCSAFEWKFWAPGAPGATLTTLGGSHTYDYMVTVAGPCEWEIPLSIPSPTPTPTPTTVMKPTIGNIPQGWYLSGEEPYGTYMDPDGIKWGLIDYTDSADGNFIIIFWGDVPNELKGHETDGGALIEKAIEWFPYVPDETGVMVVAGQTAGYAKMYVSSYDWYRMKIVFVLGSTCIDIYTLYDATAFDESQVMSLINSISN